MYCSCNLPASAWFLAAALLAPCSLAAHEAHEVFAAGQPGRPGQPTRDVAVKVVEDKAGMHFSPETLAVDVGDQVRFRITNDGSVRHEFMLDSAAHNAAHGVMMRKHPAMEHDDPNGKTLDPGESATILWRFSKPGTFEFACLIPGHYEAGMHGTVVVSSKPQAR